MFTSSTLTGSKPEQYAQLQAQAQALVHGETDRIANAANLAALIFNSLPDLPQLGRLLLLCTGASWWSVRSRACRRAYALRWTRACAALRPLPGRPSASRTSTPSPVISPAMRPRVRNWSCRWFANGELIGVLDLDSPQLARFDAQDQTGLEAVAQVFVDSLALLPSSCAILAPRARLGCARSAYAAKKT